MSQTSHDVIDSLLRGPAAGLPAERVGTWEGFWSDAIFRWVQEGYPLRRVYKELGQKRWRSSDGQWEDVTLAGEYDEPVPAWRHFGHDMAGAGGWFDIMPLRDYDEVLEESEEWEVRRNGAGASLKWWKHHMGTPEHIAFRMTSRDIWERDYRISWIGTRRALTCPRRSRTWPRPGRRAPGRTLGTSLSGRTCARAWAI